MDVFLLFGTMPASWEFVLNDTDKAFEWICTNTMADNKKVLGLTTKG